MAIFPIQLCGAYALNRASLMDADDRLELLCLNSMLEYSEPTMMVMLIVMSCIQMDLLGSPADRMDPKETSSSVGMGESLVFVRMTEGFGLELSETAHHLKPSKNK